MQDNGSNTSASVPACLVTGEELVSVRPEHHRLRYWAWVVPVWLIIPMTAVMVYQAERGTRETPIRQQEWLRVEREAALMERVLSQIRLDAVYLRAELGRVLASGASKEKARRELSMLFSNFAAASQRYHQIRWLDPNGREQVRIEMKDGHATITPDNKLQDKGDRQFFRTAKTLLPGRVYLSRLDLRMESSGTAAPPVRHPTLYLITPAYGEENGRPRTGYLALNYLAQHLIATMDQGDEKGLMLVDSQGYWLRGPRREDEWGFMTGHPEHSMAVRYPRAWARIRQAEAIQFLDSDGLWTAEHIVPSQGRDATYLPDDIAPTWYVISLVPRAEISELHANLALRIGIPAFGVLALMTWLSVRLAQAAYARDAANLALAQRATQLDDANHELQGTLAKLKSMQEELVRSEKLSSLGLLVAGVAHELNTPIGSALVAVTSLEERRAALAERLESGLRRSELDAFLENQRTGNALVLKGLERASNLVTQFKQVAFDRASAARRRFRLVDVVNEVLALLHNSLKRAGITVELHIPEDLTLDSYPGPLGQILQNLVENARLHAFEDCPPGTVRIEAETQDGGQTVCIRVIDNGVGIPPSIIGRIFDPFFTTRRGQGGTGLGLHIAHRLATEVLGGRMRVMADKRDGACFEVIIPVRAPEAQPAGTEGSRQAA